jgi:hypothetical protein
VAQTEWDLLLERRGVMAHCLVVIAALVAAAAAMLRCCMVQLLV